MALSSSQRSQRGRLGAFRLHATHDPKVTSAAGRAKILANFENGHDCPLCGRIEIDPSLPERERRRRAEYARRGHMAQLAYKSTRTRASKKKADAARQARQAA